MNNPVTLIREDHRHVEKLFSKYKSLGETETEEKQLVEDDIVKEIAIHAKMEEKFFYPKLREILGEDHPKLVEEAVAEHHEVKILLMEIKVLSVDNPQHEAKMTVLEENIKHHVGEEEESLLPLADESLSEDEKKELYEKMVEYKEQEGKSLLEKILGE